jgi:rhodanese-related sulfurtransferase
VARFQQLAPDEFATAVAATPKPFVLDVRELAAYEAGHVPGSRWILVHDLPARRSELPPSKVGRLLVVGDAGKRTEAAANFLSLFGYADVAVLDGGFAAWTGEVETGPPPKPKPPGPELRII